MNKNSIQSTYYLYGHQFKQVTAEAKYLGVTHNSQLNFNKHIDAICKKANTSYVIFYMAKSTY